MDPLQALADPTRRRIVELLSAGERSAGEVASVFDVSRPAVSRHLRMLREAGIVTARPDAQRRVYRLVPESLDELSDWIDACRATWTNRLDALDTELARGRRATTRNTGEETT